MSQYEGRTWRNPLDPSMRVWSFQRSQVPFWVDPEVEKEEEKMPLIMTEIEARRWDREDAVWFKAIVSPDKPGVGMATYVLKQIAEMGDKHKVPIFLTAKPFGNLPNKLNQSQLMSWYKRHGWRKYTEYGDSLVRFPQGDPRRK